MTVIDKELKIGIVKINIETDENLNYNWNIFKQ